MGRFLLTWMFAATLGLATAEGIEFCGEKPYYASKYTCYGGDFLCPIINGKPTLRCGPECYTPLRYSCAKETLHHLPAQRGPFTLIAVNGNEGFDGKTIEACHHGFSIGESACTHCPPKDEPLYVELCSSMLNVTALVGDSGMDVYVPGGQVYYVERSGALGYNLAHSMQHPDGATFGCDALEGGLFTFNNQDTWLACPVPNRPTLYHVFAQMPNVTARSDCVGFYAKTVDFPEDGKAAWQYI